MTQPSREPVDNTALYSIAEAKAHFSELLAKAANGQTIRITKHGKPFVTLAAAEPERRKLPRVGALKNQIWIADDFDRLGPEWDEYLD